MTPREHATVSLHPAADTVVGFGSFRFDRGNGLLSRGGEELPLPPRALAVLSVLVERAGRVVSKQELLQAAWNGAYVTETSLSEAVSLLRQVLADDSQRPVYIQTVHRRGYRFIAPLRLEETPAREHAGREGSLREAPRDFGPDLGRELERDPARDPGRDGARDPAARPATLAAATARVALQPAELREHVRAESASLVPGAPTPASAPAPAHTPSRRPSSRRLAIGTVAATVGLALAVVAFLAGRFSQHEPARAPARFAFAPPPGWKLVAYDPSLAVSPDGRRVVFTAFDDNEHSRLFERDLDRLESRPIPGTEDGSTPFFSPDGRSVGFFTEGQLRRVALAGGPPATIAAVRGGGGSWGDDGTVVFAAGSPSAIFRVAAGGGMPQRLTRPDSRRGECDHLWPQLLPGGDAILYTAWSTSVHDARVEWLSLKSGERRTLIGGGAGARFVDGRLLWARPDGVVVAAPFEPRTARLVGEATPLLANVVPHPFSGFAQVAVGGDTLVYLPGTEVPIGERHLSRLDLARPDAAEERPLATPARFYRNLKTGPDGRLAATLFARDRSDVWLVDPGSGGLRRLTFDGFNIEPVWSPDGRAVAYASNRDGPFNVYLSRTDGSAPPERLLASTHHQHPTSWSPDGRELMFGDVGPDTGYDLWVLDLATRRTRPVLRTPADEVYAMWSPDGRWFVYASDESGRYEILARTYPDLGGRWQLSSEGGFDPFWSLDGRTVYFQRDGDLWAAPVSPVGRELNPGPPHRVLRRDGLQIAAPAPGGGLYAILEQRGAAGPAAIPAEVRVVLGWQAALARGR